MKHKLYNRLLSLALAVGLVIGMLPCAAAVDTVGAAGDVQSTTTESEFDEAVEPYARSTTLTNVYYNLNGQESRGNSITIRSGRAIYFSDITPPNGYTFSKATVEGRERNSLYYDGNRVYADDKRIDSDDKIVIYYTKDTPLETVPTVDSVKDGVHIQMFDYDAKGDRGGVNTYAGDYRDSSRGLAFIGGNSSYNGSDQNAYVGAGEDAWYGILENKLDANGFPVLTNPYNQNTLKYLFDDSSTGVTAYKGAANSDGVYSLNHLFLQSEYDATGYYAYDSAKNFATLYDENGQLSQSVENFRVYSVPNNINTGDKPKFLPFNDLNNRTQTTSNNNFHFGMKMDFKFVQPKDGKVTYKGNTSNMVFTFNGDDDVWVFIDDVLVLDIGGIHQAISGTIDFATGEVLVYLPNGTTVSKRTTIYDAYQAAGYTEEQLKDIFTETADGNYIFKNYSNHTFNYYYFERGAGGSNCQMKFNIQTVPDGVIQVGKEITQAVEPGFSDAKFDMKVEVANETDGVYSAFAPYVGTYDIKNLKDNSIVKEGLTTEDGTFTLQNGQYAELKDNIKATTKYKVTELAVYGYESDYEFDLSETSMVDQEGGSVDGELGHSKEILVGETPQIVVQNKFKYNDPENPKYMFTVQKQMAAGQTTKDSFTFEITNSRGEPYTGDYYVRKIGEGLPSESQKSPNGEITIQAGQEIVILGVTSGSTFVVKEINLDSNSYDTPKYEKDGNCEGQAVDGGYSVTIQSTPGAQEVTATVTATNTLKSGSLTIEKEIAGNLSQSDFDKLKESLTFTVTGDKYNNTFKLSEFTTKPAGDAINGTYSMTIDNIPVGDYTVTEKDYNVADYDWEKVETTVDVTVTSGTTPAKASFTNTYTRQTGDLTITKTVKGLDDTALAELKNELKFTVTGPDDYSEEIAFNATGWEQDGDTYTYTINALPTGSYTVTETGYDTLEKYSWVEKDSTEVSKTANVTTSGGKVDFTNVYIGKDGKLNINKVVTGFANDGKPVFDFKLTATDGTVYYYHVDMTGTTAGETEEVASVTLPVGDYTIEELSNQNYTLKSVIANESTIENRGTITITPQGTTTVTFTNDPNNTDIPTDGGATENRVKEINDGVIVWKKEVYGTDHPEAQPSPKPDNDKE